MQEPSRGLLKRYSAFLICLAVTTACWAVYFAWYWTGFQGNSIHVFCEVDSGGLFKQDGNSISALLFVYIGLAITWNAARRRENDPFQQPRNPMLRSDFYVGVYSLATIILGYGTLAMHGSLTSLGGFLDVSSMYIWVSFCVCYALIRILRLGPIPFLILYTLLSALLIVSLRRGWLPGSESFGALITLSVILELVYKLINRKRVRFENKWAIYTGVSFFSAFGIWNLSLNGRPFYYPDTIFQGHAAWHILCAVAAWTIYRYYRSEKPVDCA